MTYLSAPGQSAFRRRYLKEGDRWIAEVDAAGAAANDRADTYFSPFVPEGFGWNELRTRVRVGGCPIFLHERTNTRGRRLVIVYAEDTVDSSLLYLVARAFRPGSSGANSEPAFSSAGEANHILFGNCKRLSGKIVRCSFAVNLCSGQPDPSDASRFSVKYDCENPSGSGYIDFHLKDDDSIEANVRDGPGKSWLSPEEFERQEKGPAKGS